jgi:hypothetical protein
LTAASVKAYRDKPSTAIGVYPIQVFSDFLRKVWKDGIEFSRLNLANPGRVPVGPSNRKLPKTTGKRDLGISLISLATIRDGDDATILDAASADGSSDVDSPT